jgi:hypothetical protein
MSTGIAVTAAGRTDIQCREEWRDNGLFLSVRYKGLIRRFIGSAAAPRKEDGKRKKKRQT